MASLSNEFWRFIIFLAITCGPSFQRTTLKPRIAAEQYLVRFGYINIKQQSNVSLGRSIAISPKEISEGLKLFQARSGLQVTGLLDEATIKKISQPRCGVKDFYGKSMFGQWKEHDLKYKWVGLLTYHMTAASVREAIQAAFNYWEKVTPLTFKEVFDEEHAHFTLKFGRYSHGDEYPFDGPHGTLAHAFFPRDGRIHFDLDEVFTEDIDRGYNLRIVAAHEIGHALGLPHSYDQEALMAPFYAGYTDRDVPLLNENDIQSIQKIYGERQNSSSSSVPPKSTTTPRLTRFTTSPTTTTEITTEDTTTTKITETQQPTFDSTTESTSEMDSIPTDKPDTCSSSTKVSAVFMGRDSKIYLIVRQEDKQWVYHNFMTSSRITDGWPLEMDFFFKSKVIPPIDAVVFTNRSKKFYLFSGTKVFIFNEFGYFAQELDTGKEVIYAFNLAERVTIAVTKDNMAWKFDPITLEFKSSKPIDDIFPGIPADIDAAAEDYPWPQDMEFIYFFKGREYFKYRADDKSRVSTGNLGDSFFGCKPYSVPKL